MLLLIATCLFSTNAFAYTAEIDGVFYNFNGYEATVTYKTTSYKSYSGDIIIPEFVIYNNKSYYVTSIGDKAFYNSQELTSVSIPNSITSMGSQAFDGCTGLAKVIVSDIAAWCGISFKNSTANPLYYAKHLYSNETTKITDLVIPDGITSISNYAFYGYSSLTSVVIPNSVRIIGNYAFRNCIGLTHITIPNNMINIGDYVFRGCTGLTSVSIPGSITSIGDYTFEECKLRNVLIKCTNPPTASTYTFAKQSFYHTTLYVPADCWDAYAYDNYWYQFIHIRETATTEEQVAMQQAYTLMDANTFTYSVYDPVNNCIGTIKSVSAIDENNPNHSWQVITDGSEQYLYNLGAKKFATNGADGRLILTAEPTPIDMENGDNGIVLGSQAARQWALVGNDRLSVEQDIITGIDEIADTQQQSESISYDLQGRRIGKPQQGVNIIRNADGTTKKVLIKH